MDLARRVNNQTTDIRLSHNDYIQGNQSYRAQSIFRLSCTFVLAVFSLSLPRGLVFDEPQVPFFLEVPVALHLPPPYRRSVPQAAVSYISSC